MTLEHPQPIQSPQSDQGWNELFTKLLTAVPLSSSHEVAVKYEIHFQEWRKPKNADEMEELESLREHFIETVKQLESSVKAEAKETGELKFVPQLMAYIARPDHYRVRQVSGGKEYALLGELRDRDGNSLLVSEHSISPPNPHAYGILIKRPVNHEEVLFEYQAIYSSQGFMSELAAIEKALKKEGMNAAFKAVQCPLLAQIISRAGQEFALHGTSKVRIRGIERVPTVVRNEGVFLLHTDHGLCNVRLMLHDGMLFPKAHAKLVR